MYMQCMCNSKLKIQIAGSSGHLQHITVIVPAEVFQWVEFCGVLHNVCLGSESIYSDDSSFCVLHQQPCSATVPDYNKNKIHQV